MPNKANRKKKLLRQKQTKEAKMSSESTVPTSNSTTSVEECQVIKWLKEKENKESEFLAWREWIKLTSEEVSDLNLEILEKGRFSFPPCEEEMTRCGSLTIEEAMYGKQHVNFCLRNTSDSQIEVKVQNQELPGVLIAYPGSEIKLKKGERPSFKVDPGKSEKIWILYCREGAKKALQEWKAKPYPLFPLFEFHFGTGDSKITRWLKFDFIKESEIWVPTFEMLRPLIGGRHLLSSETFDTRQNFATNRLIKIDQVKFDQTLLYFDAKNPSQNHITVKFYWWLPDRWGTRVIYPGWNQPDADPQKGFRLGPEETKEIGFSIRNPRSQQKLDEWSREEKSSNDGYSPCLAMQFSWAGEVKPETINLVFDRRDERWIPRFLMKQSDLHNKVFQQEFKKKSE